METRIVAFDIGDKRIGVAFSDPFGEYAVPSETYFRTGRTAEDVGALLAVAAEHGAAVIVCGLPFNADGTESAQTEKTRRFARALAERTELPVEFEDERYTTREARRDLTAMGVSAKKDRRKKSVDSLAAAYILESYLARKKKEERAMDYKEEENDYGEDQIVEIVDDEGNTYRFEHLLTFEYKGEWYCALTPEAPAEETEDDGDDEGDEVAIYRLVGDENDERLETIEDDDLLDEVFAEFCNQYEDFEDADEAAALEPDEE